MSDYRRDIDGLRAIAVLSVVAFHAGIPWAEGGFVGVDVFFVLSGYLITRIVASEIAEGRFSLQRFYVRRARRILPALFVVIATTVAAGAIVLTPEEFLNLGRLTAAAGLFVSNVVLWRDGGSYFSEAAAFKPLLHTWTLSVEEQFYIVWPLLLLLGARLRLGRGRIPVLITVGSLALSCASAIAKDSGAFYLIHARAWELSLGALLAIGVIPQATQQWARSTLSIIGVAFIAGSILLLEASALFPGYLALFPCIGAALLIQSGNGAVANRYLLSWGPMVLIGQISYSLYLWHWPLLSLGRITQGELSVTWTAVLVLAAFLLSVFTWRFIEKPFRGAAIARPLSRILMSYGLGTVGVCLAGVVIFLAGGFPQRVSSEVLSADRARHDVNPLRNSCLRDSREPFQAPGSHCWVGREATVQSIAIWGDSHADSYAPGVRILAERLGYGFLQLTAWACPPLPGVDNATPYFALRCRDHAKGNLDFLLTHPEIKIVVLAGAWPTYTEFTLPGRSKPRRGGLVDDISQVQSEANSRRIFRTALERAVDALRSAGKRVVLLADVPSDNLDVPRCIAHSMMPLGDRASCDFDAGRMAEKLRYSSATIAEIATDRADVCTFYPETHLCNGNTCSTSLDGAILYFDGQHLSEAGSRAVAKRFDLERCVPVPPASGPAPAEPVSFERDGSGLQWQNAKVAEGSWTSTRLESGFN